MATLPTTTGFYKTLLENLDLICDCRTCPFLVWQADGFMCCGSCGRYVPADDEA